jgi:hypothetical protein
MKLLNILLCFILLLSGTVSAQKKIKVSVTPVDATIFDINPATKELRQIGIGTAVVSVPKNSSTTIVLQKAGFADLIKVYSTLTDEKLPKEDLLTMKDRMVILKVLPDDAKIIVNSIELGKGLFRIIVKAGEKVNVEVKKSGFVPVKKSYSNQAGADTPPVNEEIKLTDREIQVVTVPSDAKIMVDNQVVGSGNSLVVVPVDRCAIVKIIKEGFIDFEKTYCNKEGVAELPINETFTLLDRLVKVRTAPEVSIKINGRFVAKGEYEVKVAKGECVEVLLEKDGSVPVQTKYCNQDNAPVIPVTDQFDLLVDESFTASAPSDSVNINNIIDIKPDMKEDEAWKIMSQVVMKYFDVIEITDKTTGYLRTAWSVKTFPNNTIRTRLIVKVADSSTLKYVVKLCSEASGKSGSNINDDSLYSEWHRVLETYKSVLGNIQSRMK